MGGSRVLNIGWQSFGVRPWECQSPRVFSGKVWKSLHFSWNWNHKTNRMPAAKHWLAGLAVDFCGLKWFEEKINIQWDSGGFQTHSAAKTCHDFSQQTYQFLWCLATHVTFGEAMVDRKLFSSQFSFLLRKGIARFVRLLVRRFMAASLDPAPCLVSGRTGGNRQPRVAGDDCQSR